jgi:hypothetical protein
LSQRKVFLEVCEVGFRCYDSQYTRHGDEQKVYMDLMSVIAVYDAHGDSRGFNCLVYMPHGVMYLKETYEQMKKALF